MTTTIDLAILPVEPEARHSSGWWGALIAILTEATLFAALLAAYFYLRLRAPAWPIHIVERPALMLPAVGLGVLVASSVTAWDAGRALRKGRGGRVLVMLSVTIALGVVFLVLQTIDFREKHFGVDTDATGTMYYTVVGLHTAHVVAGLLMLAFVLVRAARAPSRALTARSVEIVTLYWHFVDAVWVAVFVSLIASERWW